MEHLTGVYGEVLMGAMGAVLGVILTFLWGEGIFSLMMGQTTGCMGLF